MSNHGSPSEKDIAEVKDKYADRAIALVTAKGDPEQGASDEQYEFIITGPTRPELEKYQQEIIETKKQKEEIEKIRAINLAAERAMLAQVRWPDRPTVQKVLEKHPTMALQFVETIIGMSGDGFEVRAKKL